MKERLRDRLIISTLVVGAALTFVGLLLLGSRLDGPGLGLAPLLLFVVALLAMRELVRVAERLRGRSRSEQALPENETSDRIRYLSVEREEEYRRSHGLRRLALVVLLGLTQLLALAISIWQGFLDPWFFTTLAAPVLGVMAGVEGIHFLRKAARRLPQKTSNQ